MIIEAGEESTGEGDHRKRTTQATSSKKKKNINIKELSCIQYLALVSGPSSFSSAVKSLKLEEKEREFFFYFNNKNMANL